jgi:transmembrane sensor
MTGPTRTADTAELEAAAWHGRLGQPRVTTQTIEDFFAWREKPENADAYRRVELAWKQAGAAASSPGVQAALDAAMACGATRRSTGRPWSPFSPAAGVLAAGVVVAALIYGGWTWSAARGTYETSVGEQRLVQLADGSSVRLDTDSRVRVRLSDGRRLIELDRGQAMFTVARDPGRPFVVQAGGAAVTALGTVFEVRRDGADVRVVLLSGVVEVEGETLAAPARMRAGQETRVTPRGALSRSVDVTAAASWTEGRLTFVDAPLGEAVAEVNRYLSRPVVLGEGVDAGVAVNGVFRAGDREAFVAAASGALGLHAVNRPDGGGRLEGGGRGG